MVKVREMVGSLRKDLKVKKKKSALVMGGAGGCVAAAIITHQTDSGVKLLSLSLSSSEWK